MEVLYEDNHLIAVNKAPGEIVQGDKTGDEPLVETVKKWLKVKYNKPGDVFLGVVHRIDRPVGGVVVFAKTSKALARMNEMFRKGDVHKTYHAIVEGIPAKTEDHLVNYIVSVEANNKSYIKQAPTSKAKLAELKYKLLNKGQKYSLVEVELLTGRKHQIRVQLSSIGCPIKGDLKYGAKRSNSDGSISLIARMIEFIHPVSKIPLKIVAPDPEPGSLWEKLSTKQ